jgi:type III pantothenate kinase
MLLAIDIGSTNITIGVFVDGALREVFRLHSRREQTADEYALALAGLLGLSRLTPVGAPECVLVSVVPRLTAALAGAVRRAFHCEPVIIGPLTDLGLVLAVERPGEVGADRVVNVAAVRQRALEDGGHRGKGSGHDLGVGAIVVDLGTATTLDCLSPTGEFLGGIIAPGLRASFDGLLGGTAKLPDVELSAPPSALGKNTVDCLRSGAVFGHAALIEGLVARLRAELRFRCRVVATGGLASVVAPHVGCIDAIDPDLTLRGLELLHRRLLASASNDADAAVAPR